MSKILIATSVSDLRRINTTKFFRYLSECPEYVEGKVILGKIAGNEISIVFKYHNPTEQIPDIKQFETISSFLQSKISLKDLETTLSTLNSHELRGTNIIRAETELGDFRVKSSAKAFKYEVQDNYTSEIEILIKDDDFSEVENKIQEVVYKSTPVDKVKGF